MKKPEDILLFWFSPNIKHLWFASDLTFDQEIKKVFYDSYIEAKSGKLDHWQNSADTILPLVLLLDQFPRNMFRGERKSFATDEKALNVAKTAIVNGFDKIMGKQERVFLYMPFMHSEKIVDQKRSVELYEELSIKENLEFALRHKKVIEKFGRFPHRNKIFGRESSSEEREFLEKNPMGF